MKNFEQYLIDVLLEAQSSPQARPDVKTLAKTCARKIKAKGCTKALQDPKAKKDRISLMRTKGKLPPAPGMEKIYRKSL